MSRWLPISFASGYEVSDDGKVRGASGVVHRPTPRANGYISAYLKMPSGVKKRFYVHRLVAHAFIGDVGPDVQVNHINFCRSDNRVANLEIVTCAQNATHSKLAGRYSGNKFNAPRGEASCRSKLRREEVLEIRKLAACGLTKTELGKAYGVCKQQIANVVNRVSWAEV